MKYLAALLFFWNITAAVPEQMPIAWWSDEWGAPCTTKTDHRELGAACTGLKVRKPKGRK